MDRSRIVKGIVVLCAAFVLMPQRDALAYIDPGTGSFILQMLIAGLVGSAFALKLFWRRIVGFFSGLRRKAPQGEGNDD